MTIMRLYNSLRPFRRDYITEDLMSRIQETRYLSEPRLAGEPHEPGAVGGLSHQENLEPRQRYQPGPGHRLFVCLLGFKGASTTEVILRP